MAIIALNFTTRQRRMAPLKSAAASFFISRFSPWQTKYLIDDLQGLAIDNIKLDVRSPASMISILRCVSEIYASESLSSQRLRKAFIEAIRQRFESAPALFQAVEAVLENAILNIPAFRSDLLGDLLVKPLAVNCPPHGEC